MRKSVRLDLALKQFDNLRPATSEDDAIELLRSALEDIENKHSGTGPYDENMADQGMQLHLYSRTKSNRWKKTPSTNYSVCKLAAHYAVFGPNGEVAIFTLRGTYGGTLVYSKPNSFYASMKNVHLWP